MGIDLLFKIAAIGILVSILNEILKKADRGELAMFISITGLVIVLMMVIKEIANLFEAVKTIFNF